MRVRSSPLHRSPSRPRWSWPESERTFDIATIGTFTKADNGNFSGIIKTATLNLKTTIRPVESDNDKAPDYRVPVGAFEFGAGWKKIGRDQRDYVSIKLDDPTFPAPIYAMLVETETAGEHALIWSRPTRAAKKRDRSGGLDDCPLPNHAARAQAIDPGGGGCGGGAARYAANAATGRP